MQKTDIVTLLVFAFLILHLFSCRTLKEPAIQEETAPFPIAEPKVSKSNELVPLAVDWAGTTWIIREPESIQQEAFPGYRGFHLHKDGRLLLINLDTALGNRWYSRGNVLHLEILSGIADLPVDGSFSTYKPEFPRGDNSVRIQLVPESNPESPGLIFEKAKAAIHLAENHWTPVRLAGDNEIQWPVNSEVNLMLLPGIDGKYDILGYGGVNRFRGQVTFGDGYLKSAPLAMTRRSGPANDFEALFVQRIAETSHYVQIDKDLFFFNETEPVAAFRVKLFR